jgi:hypothetical protein
MSVANRRGALRLTLVVVLGLMLGTLLTELAVRFMPESAAREFSRPPSRMSTSITDVPLSPIEMSHFG